MTVAPYKEHTYDESRGGVYSLRYSEGSRWIAAGYQDGSIEVSTLSFSVRFVKVSTLQKQEKEEASTPPPQINITIFKRFEILV